VTCLFLMVSFFFMIDHTRMIEIFLAVNLFMINLFFLNQYFASFRSSLEINSFSGLIFWVFDCMQAYLELNMPDLRMVSNVPSKLCACARMHERTRETSAHKKTWSAHKCSLQKCVDTYFIHVVPNTNESWLDVAQKKFYAHTDFEKLEGTLMASPRAGR